MIRFLRRLTHSLTQRTRGAARCSPAPQFRPTLEALEERALPTAVTDMTALAQLFPRHAGPTTLYLNFDGYTSQGVSSFQSTSGNRTQDIHEIMYRVSEIFAPFDVQVRRIYGDGSMSTSGGNTTIFIGDKSGNGTGTSNTAYAYAPFANCDYPGSILGVHHQPNSNTFDIAYVDPVSASGSWSNTTIARAIAHEAGHTFGLAHVLSSPDQEIMSYDAANVFFVNKTFNITALNFNGTTTSNDNRLIPQWYETHYIWWFSYETTNNIVTQNSYTYLKAALGNRTTFSDYWADVADLSAVDPAYVNGYMPKFTYSGYSYSTTGGLNYTGDYDVIQFTSTTSRWINIDVKQYSSSVDPIVMLYNSSGQSLLGFNDDGLGYPNSRLTFYVSAGQSYKIVVGSYGNNSTGNYQLVVSNYYPWLTDLRTSIYYDASLTVALGGGTGSSSGAGGAPLTQQFVALQPQSSALLGGGAGDKKQPGMLAASDVARSLLSRLPAKSALDRIFSQPLHLSLTDPLTHC